MGGNQLGAARMADTNTQAVEVLAVAVAGNDIAQTVVAGGAAAALDADLAGHQVELVVDNDHRGWREPVVVRRRLDRL